MSRPEPLNYSYTWMVRHEQDIKKPLFIIEVISLNREFPPAKFKITSKHSPKGGLSSKHHFPGPMLGFKAVQ